MIKFIKNILKGWGLGEMDYLTKEDIKVSQRIVLAKYNIYAFNKSELLFFVKNLPDELQMELVFDFFKYQDWYNHYNIDLKKYIKSTSAINKYNNLKMMKQACE